jgi:hypothetical protein
VIAVLATRLTPRDRWLLRMLAEHQVLTSAQIAQLAYPSGDTARHRLIDLWRLRAVDRAQPWAPSGSAPMHYVLGDGGAAILAAEHGVTPASIGYRRERALAILASPRLNHTTGLNGVMTALVAAARTRPGYALTAWWPERRCQRQWGDFVRPDAYGRWNENGRDTDFFLEYDLGTEPVRRVAGKLAGYAALAEATGITTPVLFWFPTAEREASVHAELKHAIVPAATAAGTACPADRVWLPAGTGTARLPLHALHVPPAVSWPRDQPPAALRQTAQDMPIPPMPPQE